MSNENEFNYNIGVLIVLILMFWSLCKCMNSDNHKKEGISSTLIPTFKRRRYKKEGFVQSKDDKAATLQIKRNSNIKNNNSSSSMSEVPISKTKSRKLIVESFNYGANDDIILCDNEQSTMHLLKKQIENTISPPCGLTDIYHMIDKPQLNPMRHI